MKKLTEKQFEEVTEKAKVKVSKEINNFLQKNPKYFPSYNTFNKKIFTTYKMMFSTKANPMGLVAVVRIKDILKIMGVKK